MASFEAKISQISAQLASQGQGACLSHTHMKPECSARKHLARFVAGRVLDKSGGKAYVSVVLEASMQTVFAELYYGCSYLSQWLKLRMGVVFDHLWASESTSPCYCADMVLYAYAVVRRLASCCGADCARGSAYCWPQTAWWPQVSCSFDTSVTMYSAQLSVIMYSAQLCSA